MKTPLKLQQPIRFWTPAKVNFYLNILKKQADGLHELFLDLIPISLFDQIDLFPATTATKPLPGIPWTQNLLYKALKLLERTIGQPISLSLELTKNIPIGAGLGGGSGNAAGLLVVLNRWFKLGLDPPALRNLGLQLGADVPFFIQPQPSQATGIGEKLSPIADFPNLHLVVCYPKLYISTAKMYQQVGLNPAPQIMAGYTFKQLRQTQPTINGFWQTAIQQHPILLDIQQKLLKTKAITALLSGSGSALFGVYPNKPAAQKAVAQLNPYPSFVVQTLNQYNYSIINDF